MGDLGGSSYPADTPVLEEERTWAMAAHLGVLIGSAIPFGNFLAPFAVWLIHREKSAFVSKHALESLVFQIGLTLVACVLAVIAIATLGAGLILAVPGLFLLLGANVLYMTLGTIRASEGKLWEYPITTRFVA